MRRRSWKFQLHLGLLGTLTALPFLLAGGALAVFYVQAQQRTTEALLLSVAKDISNAIDQEIMGGVSALKALSINPSLQRKDFESFHAVAVQAKRIFPGSYFLLRQADGQQIVNPIYPWGTKLPKSDGPALLAADREALATMQPAISNTYVGASTGVHFVLVDLPLVLGGDKYLFNLGIPTESILHLIENSNAMQPGWLVGVVDRDHRIIARTIANAEFVGKMASDDFIRQMDRGEQIRTVTTLDNVKALSGYYRSTLTGWATSAAVPISVVDAPVHNAGIAVAAAGVLGLAMSLMFAGLYNRFITPPIWRLRDDAEALSQRKTIVAFHTGVAELDAVSEALAGASDSLAHDERAKSAMIMELNHRVKNSLATVQSIAQQTMRRSDTLEAFSAAFTGRLIALSKSHDALSEGGWINAEFNHLAEQICISVCGPGRIVFKGPMSPLFPRAALTLGLVLHELCTNAVKYGALSNATGSVLVESAVEADPNGHAFFAMQWTESGGSPVSGPAIPNFGTRFIAASIRHELKGTTTFDFRPEGLVFVCRFPMPLAS